LGNAVVGRRIVVAFGRDLALGGLGILARDETALRLSDGGIRLEVIGDRAFAFLMLGVGYLRAPRMSA
jgi:hypothetical protein